MVGQIEFGPLDTTENGMNFSSYTLEEKINFLGSEFTYKNEADKSSVEAFPILNWEKVLTN